MPTTTVDTVQGCMEMEVIAAIITADGRRCVMGRDYGGVAPFDVNPTYYKQVCPGQFVQDEMNGTKVT
jgi:hypothetical protein